MNSLLNVITDRLGSLIADPLIPGLMLVAMVLLGALAASGRWRYALVAIFAFFITLAPAVRDEVFYRPPPPFDLLVLYGRTFALILLPFLLLTGLQASWRPWSSTVPPVAVALLGYHLFWCARYIVGFADPMLAVSKAAGFVVLFVVFIMVVGRWLQNYSDSHQLHRAVAAGAAAFLIAQLAVWAVGAHHVSLGGRFFGLTANANHLGANAAIALLIFVALASSPLEPKPLKLVWMACAAGTVGLLFLSGSRTGMGMAAVAVLMFFRIRLGRLFAVALPIAVLAYLWVGYLDPSEFQTGRFTSLEDTRSHKWMAYMDVLHQTNPIFGNTDFSMGGMEGSYITVLAQTGYVGVMVFSLVMATTLVLILKCVRASSTAVPQYRVLLDMTVACVCSIAAGAVFEGLLFSSFSYMIFALYMCLVLGHFALQQHSSIQQAYGRGYAP